MVLANTHEYRQPSERTVKAAAAAVAAANASKDSVELDMISRFLGLVVLPGHHIVKIEVEQFASQMKGRSALAKRPTETA